MPLYEYHCPSCDATVELLIRNAQEKPICPECGSKKLQKEFSVTAAPVQADRSGLPVARTAEGATCGRAQCQSGCMFE